MRFAIILALSLSLAVPAFAGPKGRLVGLNAEYQELKANVLREVADVDEARKQGYSSDTKSLQKLISESLQLMDEANKFYLERQKAALQERLRFPEMANIYALTIACSALYEVAHTEFRYQIGEKSPFVLTIRAKYEDLLRLADDELRRQAEIAR